MKNKGITLVALIITIIIILILAAVGISISLSVIDNTKRATFISKMTAIEEAVSLKILNNQIDLLSGNITTDNIFENNATAEDISNKTLEYEILKGRLEKQGEEVPETIEEMDIAINDILSELFKLGVDITGDASYASIYDAGVGAVYKIEPVIIGGKPLVGTGNTGLLAGKKRISQDTNKIIITKGEYKKINGEYLCIPDLRGFNTSDTYYVTFANNDIKPIIGNKIGREEPTDWFDYTNKKWANIVVNNENTAYFVWIPRYVYKIEYFTDSTKQTPTNDITQYGTTTIKFIDTNNKYIAPNGTESNFTELEAEGYKLPEGFNFGGAAQLAGIWVAKYEMSNSRSLGEIKRAAIIPNNTSIKVEIISNIANRNTSKNDVYLNGTKIYTGELPYEITNLESNKEYEVTVRAYLADENPTNVWTRVVKTVARATANAPDLSGFVKSKTYYITYNADGTIKDKVSILPQGENDSTTNFATPPIGWYDYSKKEWANILVENTVNGNSKQAYFVWIPRYEYEKIPEGMTYTTTDGKYGVEVNFINGRGNVPSPGFLIPEGFTFGGEELLGIWVAKYEMSN